MSKAPKIVKGHREQVLRTWEAVPPNWGRGMGFSKLEWGGGGLGQYMGGAWRGIKTLLKNTCEGVHLLVNLPGISQEACKSAKNELLHAYFSRIWARL